MDDRDESSSVGELTYIRERLSRIEQGMLTKPSEGRRFSLAQATIGGAILTLIGGIGGAGLDAYYSAGEARANADLAVELETRRFEAELILRAVDVEDREAAIRNLRFFVAAGFISDDEGRISQLDDRALPSSNSAFSISAHALIGATYNLENNCTAIAISPTSVIAPSYCVDDASTDQTFLLKNAQGAQAVKVISDYISGSLVELQTVKNTGALFPVNIQYSREPIPGEPIFFASSLLGLGAEIQQCEVVENDANEAEFYHNCNMVQGEGGAGIFAVTDGAPLGVAMSMDSRGIGSGFKLNRF